MYSWLMHTMNPMMFPISKLMYMYMCIYIHTFIFFSGFVIINMYKNTFVHLCVYILYSNWGDWIDYCEDVGEAIWAKGVSWLVAVEGTNADCQDSIWCAWGENLIGVKNKGITFDYTGYGANRFVWSPHVYGGDVTGNWNYNNDAWENHWGYLADYSGNGAALVVGEFGTKYTGSMVNWLNSLVDYLISIDQRNTFYWCLYVIFIIYIIIYTYMWKYIDAYG